MQIFYIVLGSVLALTGGIIAQLFQSHLERKRADKDVLSNILSIFPKVFEAGHLPDEEKLEELISTAKQIRTICYRKLAIEIIAFKDKSLFAEADEIKALESKIEKKVGKPLYIYEKKRDDRLKKLSKGALKEIEKEKEQINKQDSDKTT